MVAYRATVQCTDVLETAVRRPDARKMDDRWYARWAPHDDIRPWLNYDRYDTFRDVRIVVVDNRSDGSDAVADNRNDGLDTAAGSHQ